MKYITKYIYWLFDYVVAYFLSGLMVLFIVLSPFWDLKFKEHWSTIKTNVKVNEWRLNSDELDSWNKFLIIYIQGVIGVLLFCFLLVAFIEFITK